MNALLQQTINDSETSRLVKMILAEGINVEFGASPRNIYDLGFKPISRDAARASSWGSSSPESDDFISSGTGQEQFGARVKEVLAKQNLQRLPLNATNWSDHRLGDVTVVAYSHSRYRVKKPSCNTETIHYWVVRCVCGKYEMRADRSLRKWCRQNPDTQRENCCQSCRLERSKMWKIRNTTTNSQDER